MLFVKDTRSTITSNEDNKDITKQIAEKWQLLSVNEKQVKGSGWVAKMLFVHIWGIYIPVIIMT